jgi:excisionase family DNA binding protein
MPDQQLYRVTEAMAILAISRSVIYEEMRSGRLGWVKRGRSRRIPASDILDYLELLKAETEKPRYARAS